MAAATKAREPYRTKVETAPPGPLAVKGPCRFVELIKRVAPERTRHRKLHACPVTATRRVQVGLNLTANVCFWHSLVATERLHAHLIRDLGSP